MADTRYDDNILGGAIGHPDPERWRHILHECNSGLFVGSYADLYDLGARFFRATGHPIDYAAFSDMARQLAPELRITLDAEFVRLWHTEVSEAHFRWAVKAIRDQRRDERLVTGLMEAMRVMTEGVGGQQGYDAARKTLTAALGEIDRNFSPTPPFGNIRDDSADVWADYLAAIETQGLVEEGVQTGLPEIDQRIIQMRRGENMLVAAYSGEGKTTTIQNIAWHVAVAQGKTVLVLTNENQYEQYRARVYNRHAHLFRPGGIPHNDIRTGSLDPATAQLWQQAVHDFGTNPAYGRLEIVQMPTGASMTWVVNQLDRYSQEMDVDLVVLDYIGRLGAMTARPTRRDETNDNLTLWKSALVGYDNGRGVPGITGYQVSRQWWEEAQRTLRYSLLCLAETSEAERNADLVVSQLRTPGVDNELLTQVLKNRDGATLEPTPLRADFATTLITSAGQTGWLT